MAALGSLGGLICYNINWTHPNYEMRPLTRKKPIMLLFIWAAALPPPWDFRGVRAEGLPMGSEGPGTAMRLQKPCKLLCYSKIERIIIFLDRGRFIPQEGVPSHRARQGS